MKKIVIIGASGFIGGHLSKYLRSKNYDVISLSRSKTESKWNPEKLDGWEEHLKSSDIVINLAGANVGEKRWTKNRKNILLNSRLTSIDSILQGLKETKQCPELYIQISGIGYYGNKADEILTEETARGEGFMAELSESIETRVLTNNDCIDRKVLLRFGIVLGNDGGALPKMIFPFKMFIGGPFGKGRNYMSWIHIEDVCKMIEFIIMNKNLAGVINGVSPKPVKNKKFSTLIGKALKRPSLFPVPPFFIKILLGQMASELLLFSQRVEPKKLQNAGFNFKYPDLKEALSNLLKRK